MDKSKKNKPIMEISEEDVHLLVFEYEREYQGQKVKSLSIKILRKYFCRYNNEFRLTTYLRLEDLENVKLVIDRFLENKFKNEPKEEKQQKLF